MTAASLNDKLVDSLRGFSPELADMVQAASTPMAQVLKSTADITQQQVANFFRQQNIRQVRLPTNSSSWHTHTWDVFLITKTSLLLLICC